jgi:hypothetical protein
MKLNTATALVIGSLAACALLVDFSPAGAGQADQLPANQLPTNQGLPQSQLDRLARPADPQAGNEPTLGNPAAAGADRSGSFPRSFLIPGTSTSVRIGGAVDETMGYHRNGP